jgi:hypothetical protein
MPTGFFDLPRELRDEIYDNLWDSIPRVLIPYSPAVRLKVCFDVTPRAFGVNGFCSLPPGISASKSLLHEALSAFDRKGVVHIDDCYEAFDVPWRDEKGSWRTGLDSIEYAFNITKFSPPVLTPLAIGELRLHIDIFNCRFVDVDGSIGQKSAVLRKDARILINLVDKHTCIGAPKSWKIYATFTPIQVQFERRKIFLTPFYDLGRIAQDLTSVDTVMNTWDTWESEGSLTGLPLCEEMEAFGRTVLPNMRVTTEKIELYYGRAQWRFKFTKVYCRRTD